MGCPIIFLVKKTVIEKSVVVAPLQGLGMWEIGEGDKIEGAFLTL